MINASDPYDSPISPELSITLGIMMVAVGVFAVLGNALSFMWYSRKKVRKRFVFQNCLSIVQGLQVPLALWMNIASIFQKRWLYGEWGVQYYTYVQALLSLFSIGCLAVIALERYVAIACPLTNRLTRIKHKLAVVVGLIVYTLCLSTPPLIGWGAFVIDGHKVGGTFDYMSRDWNNRSYIIYLFAFGYFAPLILISGAYAGIWRQFRGSSDKLRSNGQDHPSANTLTPLPDVTNFRTKAVTVSLNTETQSCLQQGLNISSVAIDGTGEKPHTSFPKKNNNMPRALSDSDLESITSRKRCAKRRVTEFRLAVTSFLTIGGFLLAWTPYAVTVLIALGGKNVWLKPEVATVCAIFAKSSVVYNPIIYAFRDHKIWIFMRKQFVQRFPGYNTPKQEIEASEHRKTVI